mgnify:FL=1
MALDKSFYPLIKEGPIDGFFDLQYILTQHVDEEKIGGIMQQVLIRHNDMMREAGGGFSPWFQFTESERGVVLNYHRPSMEKRGPGESYGTLDFVQRQPKGKSFFLLEIDNRSWETLKKEELQGLTITQLKAHISVLAPYLDVMEHSFIRGIANTYGRVTASQRRVYSYILIIGDIHVTIRQIRANKVVSEYTHYVTMKLV